MELAGINAIFTARIDTPRNAVGSLPGLRKPHGIAFRNMMKQHGTRSAQQ